MFFSLGRFNILNLIVTTLFIFSGAERKPNHPSQSNKQQHSMISFLQVPLNFS